MPGRLQFCRESVIQQRVQRFTGLARRVLAIGYVLIPNSAMINLIVYPGYTRPHNRGSMAIFLSETADYDDPADSVAITTLRMNSSSQTIMDTFSTTPVDLKRAVKTS